MKFLCVVHVCFCVGCERGCVCVHLACCIIKAPMLPSREKKEVKFEEEEVEKTGSRYRTNYRIKE